MWNAIDHSADIWWWCASWVGAWLVLSVVIHLRPLLSGQLDVLRGIISANSRTLVMFAAWWLSRAISSYVVSTGFWHWAICTVLFFIFIAIALALMGKIGSGEFRGKMLVREVIAALIAIFVVFLWSQGVIHMSGSAKAQPSSVEAKTSQ
jgi:hypothetical protein